MRRIATVVAVVASVVLVCVSLFVGNAGAQAADPSQAETARLLGYLWADGSQDGDVWDATAPSGGATLIEYLVEQHGGQWVDRAQLRFRLPAEYSWQDWFNGLPDDDDRVRRAVENPHFLAALLEGEGLTNGLVYDQSSCCTPFGEGRLTELMQLLDRRGFDSATLTTLGDRRSGEIRIASNEFAELRQSLQFVCPASGDKIRVPGGENYTSHGPIRWFGLGSAFGTVVRTDCVEGRPISSLGPAVGDCVVTVERDRRLRVTWSFALGDVRVDRDGRFLTRVSARDNFVVDAPPARSASYSVRVFNEGVVTDRQCGTKSTDAAPETPPTPGARCEGHVITVLGTGGVDRLVGTDGVDVIHGFGGNDRLSGFDGPDILCGGDGDDVIAGGFGADVIVGGSGDDEITAGGGRDTVFGNAGNDVLYGNNGVDDVRGGTGNDRLFGNRGIDRLDGGSGNDTLQGGQRIDECVGGGGVDSFDRCERIS